MAMFLLDVMPERTAEHYRNKIARLPALCIQTRGFPDDIPDEQENDLEWHIPSWRRICKTLIKNDFWCRNFPPSVRTNPWHDERYSCSV